MPLICQIDDGDITVDIRANGNFQVFTIQCAICLDQHIAIDGRNGIVRLAESLDGNAFKLVLPIPLPQVDAFANGCVDRLRHQIAI